jgi:hypothetical protein
MNAHFGLVIIANNLPWKSPASKRWSFSKKNNFEYNNFPRKRSTPTKIRRLILLYRILLYIFLIILQNYTTVWNFSRSSNQPPCTTAATVPYDGWQRNRHAPQGQGTANGLLRGAAPAAAYRRGPRRSGLRPLWATTVGSYRRGGRQRPHLYKGWRRPPTPIPATASYSVDRRRPLLGRPPLPPPPIPSTGATPPLSR